MKKTIIVLMMVLLSLVLLVVSCDDKFTTDQSDNNENTSGNGGNESGNGGNAGGAEVLPTNIKVGDEVKIGTVTWKALAVDDENDRALLISKDILENVTIDAKPYEKSSLYTTLRSEEFLNKYGLKTSYMKKVVFTDSGDKEIAKISDSGVDYLFLLSGTEAYGTESYFADDESRIATYNDEASSWWLRTSDAASSDPEYSFVRPNGDVWQTGYLNKDNFGVRPAFWYAWAETEYKITYTIGDGATAANGNPSSYTRFVDTTKNEAVTISKAPTKDGYAFKGWKLKGADDSTAAATYTITADTTGDIELVAVWKKNLTEGDAISNVGDIIEIGKKGEKAICWVALSVDTENNRALLISWDILEKSEFNETETSSYTDSKIQKYLDSKEEGGFIKTYGINESYIVLGNISTKQTTANNGTETVFLLSEDEAKSTDYFSSDSSRVAKYEGSAMAWWLRSTNSSYNNYFNYVGSAGTISDQSYSNQFGIRPAFWYTWTE